MSEKEQPRKKPRLSKGSRSPKPSLAGESTPPAEPPPAEPTEQHGPAEPAAATYTVTCVVCSDETGAEALRPHTNIMGVFVCPDCHEFVTQPHASQCRADGIEEYCTVCRDGGEMFLCDATGCVRVFCTVCLEGMFGKEEFERLEKSEERGEQWDCLVCNPTQVHQKAFSLRSPTRGQPPARPGASAPPRTGLQQRIFERGVALLEGVAVTFDHFVGKSIFEAIDHSAKVLRVDQQSRVRRLPTPLAPADPA